jgi:hypothetical protein
MDKFIRGSVLQSTELLQSMRDLSRTRLAEKMRSERAMYVCTVGGLYSLGNSYSRGRAPHGTPIG